ncbi:uncharacterized protein G2W53_015169 [Senna tora]|uniref:Uncharacterized protein n=1 Tax=Senna tora TaxID=362788 RepID=A0A834WUS4_9FABA|nr:uncharacterized protein G2W53_015169 [Senna tora]
MATGQISRCIRSLGAVVLLQQILPAKTEMCFGRVKEKKPPPPRKMKCLVWSFSNDDFVKTTVVEWERIGISKDCINIVVFCNY